jgi:hypothetical protein
LLIELIGISSSKGNYFLLDQSSLKYNWLAKITKQMIIHSMMTSKTSKKTPLLAKNGMNFNIWGRYP